MTAAPGSIHESEPRRIHLFRPQNQLGDLLLNVPAIRSIRERYPRARITLVVGKQNAAAVMGQAWADEVRVVEPGDVLGFVRAALPRGERPDLAVYFTTVSYSKGGGLLVRASRARERIGFDPARYGRRDHAGLTRALPYPEGTLHQSGVSGILAAAVGAGPPPPPPHFVPDPTLAAGAPGGTVYLHPGAGKVKNRWPAERFGTTARELVRRGLEPIARLAARFARASLYIGNDTGPLHLAAATGCPTVGLYGWSDPGEWAPVGRRVRSVRAADFSLESIDPALVLDTALPLLMEERCATA